MSLLDDRSEGVARALTAAFGRADYDAAAPLSGGLSGAGVYRLTVAGTDYLMRLDGPGDAFRDPNRWYKAMQIAAEAGVAPPVLYASPEDRIAITAFVRGQTLRIVIPAEREATVAALGQLVARLHAAPAFARPFDAVDYIELMVDGFSRKGLVSAVAAQPVVAAFADLAAVYRRLAPMEAPSHNDLNPRNILDDGTRLWLIDWEAAFQADRFLDLAGVANFFNLEGPELRNLLAAYFGEEPTLAQRSRLFLARQLNRMLYAMIFLNAAAEQRPDVRLEEDTLAAEPLVAIRQALGDGSLRIETFEGHLRYGRALAQAAVDNIRGPNFATAATNAA